MGEMLLCISWCFNLPFSCDRRLNNHVVTSPPHCSPGNCLSFPHWTIHFSFTQSQRHANGDSEVFKAIQYIIKRWQRCLWSLLSLTFRKAILYIQMLTYIFFANLRIKRLFKVRARRAPRGSLTREEGPAMFRWEDKAWVFMGQGRAHAHPRQRFHRCRCQNAVTLILNKVSNLLSSGPQSRSHVCLLSSLQTVLLRHNVPQPSSEAILPSFWHSTVWGLRHTRQFLWPGSSGCILKQLHLYYCSHLCTYFKNMLHWFF